MGQKPDNDASGSVNGVAVKSASLGGSLAEPIKQNAIGDHDDDNGKIDPAKIDAERAGRSKPSEPAKRGRGRPSKRQEPQQTDKPERKEKTQVHLSEKSIADLLFNIHAMFATYAKMEAMNLSQNECDKISAAAVKVARHYPALQVSEKTTDIMNLIMVLGAVYPARFAYMKMKADAQRKANAPPAENVAPVNSPMAGTTAEAFANVPLPMNP